MEKHYEKPEANVIRYRNRVRTNQEDFTDSAGVQYYRFTCADCGRFIYMTPADDPDLETAYQKWKEHDRECKHGE